MSWILSNFFQQKEPVPEEEGWSVVETMAPTPQFYNVRGWEVVDECEVLAETSQNEAVALHFVLKDSRTSHKLQPTTPPATKRSSANCVRPPASDVLDRLAPRKAVAAAVAVAVGPAAPPYRYRYPQRHPPSASATTLGFSYAAMASIAAAPENTTGIQAEPVEEVVNSTNVLSKQEEEGGRKEIKPTLKAPRAAKKARTARTTPIPFSPVWPVHVPVSTQPKAVARSWAQMCA